MLKGADMEKKDMKSLKAVYDGSHMIEGIVYTFKKGDTVKVTEKHYKSMKTLTAFNG